MTVDVEPTLPTVASTTPVGDGDVAGPDVHTVHGVPTVPRDQLAVRLRAALVWILVVVLATTTTVASLAWRSASTAEATRDRVTSAVTGLAIDLVTWDAATLADTAASLRTRGTGDFLTQIDDVIAGAQQLSEAVDGSSRGEVLDALVDVDGDVAIAVVIVRQTLRAAGQETTGEQVMRVALKLIDGQWLVDQVELINVPVPIAVDEETAS